MPVYLINSTKTSDFKGKWILTPFITTCNYRWSSFFFYLSNYLHNINKPASTLHLSMEGDGLFDLYIQNKAGPSGISWLKHPKGKFYNNEVQIRCDYYCSCCASDQFTDFDILLLMFRPPNMLIPNISRQCISGIHHADKQVPLPYQWG